MKAQILFEPRDLWIGVFWDRRPGELRVYVCLIPTLPLLLTFGAPAEEDPEPWRPKATPEQRASCQHPAEDRCPLSGDGWMCGLCGAYVPPPNCARGDHRTSPNTCIYCGVSTDV